MGNVSSSLNSIEDDHKDMALLLKSAKFGKWEAVWGILEKKPYMINCCPENRRWTVLQQAVNLVEQTLGREKTSSIPYH